MKKNLMHAAVMFAVFMGGSAVSAQMSGADQGGGQWGHGQGQPMTADQRLQHMTQQLNLSDAQQQQIKPILENEEKQMQTMRQDSSLSRDDRMSKMQQIRQDTSSQIKPILTADQQQKYAQMMSRQGHGRGGQGQNPPPSQATPPQ
jgi:periplasmic protein CpxP/Spy